MYTPNRLNEIFETLRKKSHSILLSRPSQNDHDFQYIDINFKSWVLDPFIIEVINTIDDLEYDELLINKIDFWIEDFELFLSENLHRKNTTITPIQKSLIDYFISKLTDEKLSISNFLEDNSNNIDSKLSNTILTRNETVLLMLYLQEQKAILPEKNLSTKKLSDAFETLTWYKSEQMRKTITKDSRVEKNLISTFNSNYDRLKSLLEAIIEQIEIDKSNFF